MGRRIIKGIYKSLMWLFDGTFGNHSYHRERCLFCGKITHKLEL